MECRENNVIWSVSTEGDDEGRSTKNLGLYRGSIENIAFHLADKCYYQLYIKPYNPKVIEITELKPTNSIVHVNTSDLKFEIENKNITTESGRYYNSVKLNFNNEKEYKRIKALSKLTQEEKDILGL